MNNILLLIIRGEANSVNQPALTEALRRYTTQSFDGNIWLIKTNAQATEVGGTIRAALGGAEVLVTRFDYQAAVLPDDMKRFVTAQHTAAA